MKLVTILESVADILLGVQTGGKARDPKLRTLDRAVLEVAIMLAALDGTILPAEYAAFDSIARGLRGYTEKGAKACLTAALKKAGYLMALAQVGVYSEEERLDAFLEMAEETMSDGFAAGTLADLRRAFALWVSIGVSDGEFSEIERHAVEELRDRYAQMRFEKAQESELKWSAVSPLYNPTACYRSYVQKAPLLEADFLEKAERITRNLAVARQRAKATADLEALVGIVEVNGPEGTKVVRQASEIKLF